jgi:protein-glutamine gamma-glutamyltransferase
MYDIRQFRPTLYLLIAMGFCGFSIATESGLTFVLSMASLMINAWLVKRNLFRPMPRFLAGVFTLLSATYFGLQLSGRVPSIIPIGQFLMVLQLVKLFEFRGNRDYAQLLVLSLLLMVASAISTYSLVFGVLFMCYLLLSLYGCLLFHLKVETDHAKMQLGLPDESPNPMTLRQDQRYFNRSMTGLTAFAATMALASAVVVFLLFPRTPGAAFLNFNIRSQQAQTGFGDQVSFQNINRIATDTTEVAWVRVRRNGQDVKTGPLYFRGNTVDRYESDPNADNRWQWTKSTQHSQRLGYIERVQTVTADSEETLIDPAVFDRSSEFWVQEFRPLQPMRATALFALPGVAKISSARNLRVTVSHDDQTLSLEQPLMTPLDYSVVSTNELLPIEDRLPGNPSAPRSVLTDLVSWMRSPASVGIDPRIREYAVRPEVIGQDDAGMPLHQKLNTNGRPNEITGVIARNIEQHLRREFSYTLDLSGEKRVDDDANRDPMVWFLYDVRKGHCQYFASAMTLMCQSIGMQARIVQGYKCDEYNDTPGAGYFIVRQSHAHAWVEVLTPEGWTIFDPTTGNEAQFTANPSSVWTKFKHFFDLLEHTWANSVIAYDSGTQTNLLDQMENQMSSTAVRSTDMLRDWKNSLRASSWFSNMNRYTISEKVLTALVALMTAALVGLIAWFFIQRWRLGRRARRIGLGDLGRSERQRLARQLGFYDSLIRVLERRDIRRKPHLTPLEFSQSLSFLPAEQFARIIRLTRLFYRVRFGETQLKPELQKRLQKVVDGLDERMPETRQSG